MHFKRTAPQRVIMDAKASLGVMLFACIVLGVLRSGPSAFDVAGGHEVVELDFWNGFTGPDGRRMLEMIRRFNEENPDVRVTMQRMEWAIYYNKLMVAGIGGRGPEMFVIHASMLPRMHRGGFIGDLGEMFVGDHPLPRDDFESRLLDQLTFDGHLKGVPMDIHPQGLYCNAALLREAGIVDADGRARPPQTREEFLEAMRRLRVDRNGDGRPEQWGFALSTWRFNFMSLVPQFGGRYFDEQGRCVLDSDENVEALNYFVSLLREHGLIPQPENNLGWVGFRQGRVAMVFEGVYMLGDLQRLENLDYIAAPMPRIGPFPGTHADSHVLCIREEIIPEKRAAALRFFRYLSDHGVEWAAAGQVPARRSARESAEFLAMQVQAAMAQQVDHVMYPPRSPGTFELQQEIDIAVEKAMRGRASPREALRQARENFERFMRNAGLPMLAEESS